MQGEYEREDLNVHATESGLSTFIIVFLVHGTVCQQILEHQIRLCAPASVISRPTCFSSRPIVYAAADWWLNTVRPAPLYSTIQFIEYQQQTCMQ